MAQILEITQNQGSAGLRRPCHSGPLSCSLPYFFSPSGVLQFLSWAALVSKRLGWVSRKFCGNLLKTNQGSMDRKYGMSTLTKQWPDKRTRWKILVCLGIFARRVLVHGFLSQKTSTTKIAQMRNPWTLGPDSGTSGSRLSPLRAVLHLETSRGLSPGLVSKRFVDLYFESAFWEPKLSVKWGSLFSCTFLVIIRLEFDWRNVFFYFNSTRL